MQEFIYYNSWDKEYKKPFGAVEIKNKIKFTVKSKKEVESIILHINKDAEKEVLINMIKKEDGLYTCDLNPEKLGLYFYFFEIRTIEGTLFYGNNKWGFGGEGQIYNQDPKHYQFLVYEPWEIPKWYRDGIMYQIFPDRFFDGKRSRHLENAKPNSLIHANWDDTPFYIKDDLGSVVKWDFFGGNLVGIEKKLNYLKNLGINIIYLNPIFDSISNHRYDTSDYKKIDPLLGTEEDFEKLCLKAEKKGISIILDGVFSHTGKDSLYFDGSLFDSVGAYNSKDSKYFSWYKFSEYPEKYSSWWGIKSLPEVDEMQESYQDYIIMEKGSVIEKWMQKGIKGWRLDVADELPDVFIEKLRNRCKKLDPESIIIGEVWEDASNKISYGERRKYFWGHELDGVTNYPFRSSIIDFLLSNKPSWEILYKIESLKENYPKESFYSNMNILGNHDVSRIINVLSNQNDESKLTLQDKYNYSIEEEFLKKGKKRLKMASLIQMTLPGIPCIYYGDEVGLQGYSDPFNRRTYPWGNEDKEILSWYKKIIRIRNSNQALRTGNFEGFFVDNEIFSYKRYIKNRDVFNEESKEQEFLIICNRSEIQKLIKIPNNTVNTSKLRDILNGNLYEYKDDEFEIIIEPLEAIILKGE